MAVKNLFDHAVKQEIIARINKLTPRSQRQWCKMEVAQLLVHFQTPLGVTGELKLKGCFLLNRSGLYLKINPDNDKSFRQDLPTDKSFN